PPPAGPQPRDGLRRAQLHNYLNGTITTPLGATNVKVRSGSPLFTAIFVKRMVTVFSNLSCTTAFLISQPFGSIARMRRASDGSGCFGVRSSTQLPSASLGWAGLRKRASNSDRSLPSPARKLPAGPARASGASATFAWFSVGGYTQSFLPSETVSWGVGSGDSPRGLP